MTYYIAPSASTLKTNADSDRGKHPYFFVVDVDSLRQVEMTSLYDIEMLVHKHSKTTKHLAKSQAWPKIEDSNISRRIWLFLGRGIEEYQQFHKQPLILYEPVNLSKKYLSLKWRQFCEKHEPRE